MLQDLESRQQEPVGGSANYQPPAKSSLLPWFIALVLLVICAGFAYQMLSQRSINTVATSAPETTSEASETAKGELQHTNNTATEAANEKATEDSQVLAQAASDENRTIEPTITNHQTVEYAETNAVASLTEKAVNEKVVAQEPDIQQAPEKAIPQQIAVASQALEAPQVTPVFEMTSNVDKTSSRSLKQLAQDALQIGDSVEAARYLNQLVGLEPANLPARKKLAALLFAQNQHRSTEALLMEGLNVHPDSAELRLMLARLYGQNSQREKAHDLLQKFSVNALLEPDYLAYRASLADQLSRYEPAKTDYLALAQAYPDNSKWWLGLAVTQERLGENQGALIAYQKANNLNQLSTEVATFVQQRLQFLGDER